MMTPEWRDELPVLTSRLVSLREPASHDLGPVVDLLAISDACRFGIDEPISEVGVMSFIERASRERLAGVAFAYTVTLAATRAVVGLVRVPMNLNWLEFLFYSNIIDDLVRSLKPHPFTPDSGLHHRL